jgi:phospholipase/lecithinase/hemolysin
MKSVFHCTIVILLFELVALPANAAFKSLYVFGDALSSTADGTGSLYYAGRDSNGRVWVEVLAQRQGLTYDATKNNSYYDHNSAITVTDVKNFTAPADVTNDLFIVWVCNADTFDAAQVPDNSTQWQAAINQAQTNHLQIITNLYARGVRTLILPNVVDISQIPAFNAGTTLTNVEHAGCVAYNVAFSNTIKQARALCPGLKIYAPDFFTLLNNVLTNAANYGLTNALSAKGFSIDALTALYAKAPVQLNGPGTNYIFWDNQDPTAEFHEVIADVVQQSISPVQIGQITALNGSNQLYVVNVPVGLFITPAQHPLRRFPADARIGDAKRRSASPSNFLDRLAAFKQMALDHQADERFRAFNSLLNDAAPDILLLREFFSEFAWLQSTISTGGNFSEINFSSAARMLSAS